MPIKRRGTGETVSAARSVSVDELKAFRNHGFRQKGMSGGNVSGDCLFCGKADHLFINPETKMWDCKRCGREGGFQTFLEEVVNKNLSNPALPSALQELSKDRHIAVETLQAAGIGFSQLTGEYTLPVYAMRGTDREVWDVRRYKIGGALKSTADCKLGILNWDQSPAFDKIWLCEGEWDALACTEMLSVNGIGDTLALGLPGANTFKPEWLSIFKDKKVICAYDADEPGRRGAVKGYNMLQRAVKSVKFIQWGEVRDGYDLRDAYSEHGAGAYAQLLSKLGEYPEGIDTAQITGSPDAGQLDGEGLTAEEVYAQFQKWLYLPDTAVIDVIFGSIIGNRQAGDPLWMFIVAPPGGTKTEPLRTLAAAPHIVYKNTLSAKSLVSGQIMAAGADPSLLPRLHEKILVVEDWTALLSLPAAFREEIFGILRSAFNGTYERDYGNGRIFKCDCHFGILAAVTPAIEHEAEQMAALGERFLSYYPPIPRDIRGRRPFLEAARRNTSRVSEMREELLATSSLVLKHNFTISPDVPTAMADRTIDAAQWTSMMRGVVKRERFSSMREVTHEPYAELGTRLVTQFTKLLDGIGRFRRVGTVTEREFEIVRRIAYGSTPSDRRRFIEVMWCDNSRGWSTAEISDATGLPRHPMCERIAETLSLLGIIRKSKAISGLRATYLWHLRDDFGALTESVGIFN